MLRPLLLVAMFFCLFKVNGESSFTHNAIKSTKRGQSLQPGFIIQAVINHRGSSCDGDDSYEDYSDSWESMEDDRRTSNKKLKKLRKAKTKARRPAQSDKMRLKKRVAKGKTRKSNRRNNKRNKIQS